MVHTQDATQNATLRSQTFAQTQQTESSNTLARSKSRDPIERKKDGESKMKEIN